MYFTFVPLERIGGEFAVIPGKPQFADNDQTAGPRGLRRGAFSIWRDAFCSPPKDPSKKGTGRVVFAGMRVGGTWHDVEVVDIAKGHRAQHLIIGAGKFGIRDPRLTKRINTRDLPLPDHFQQGGAQVMASAPPRLWPVT